MRLRAPAALLVSVVILSACSDSPTTTATRVPATLNPNATVLDGANGGNPHFYFLPPMVAQPTTTGVFNPKLAPTVEICTTTAQNAQGHCQSLLASFSSSIGVNNNGQYVTINVSGQQYILNWNTKLYTLTLDQPFRIVVLLGNLQIGFADVVARKGGKFENATTGTTIDLVNNRTLPIKFRIENGVVCGSNTDCFEGLVGPEGGTFVVTEPDGTIPAGTSFPAGALSDTVNLIIEKVTDAECLPTDLQQFQDCYHFSTEPHVDNFNLPVTVGVCMSDPAGVSYFNDGQLRLWKWSEVTGSPLQELERVQIDYLNCPNLTSSSLRIRSPILRGMAHAGSMLFGPIARLLAPEAAYAIGTYEGGKLSNFSRIGWVRPLALQISAGDGQTGFAGYALAIQPQVKLVARYGSQPGVTGWVVNFTPSGDGTAVPPSVVAGPFAATTWTLASTPGANTLLAKVNTSRAIAPAPYEVQVTFNANGVQFPNVTFMPPLVSSSTSGTFMSGLSPLVVISEVNGATLQTLNALENVDKYQTAWDVPTLDPAKTYRIAVVMFGLDLGHVDLVVIGTDLTNVSTGDKVLNLANSRNLPIKFVLWH